MKAMTIKKFGGNTSGTSMQRFTLAQIFSGNQDPTGPLTDEALKMDSQRLKTLQREKLGSDLAEFLAAGGKIQTVAPGVCALTDAKNSV